MKVHEVMSRGVECTDPGATLQQVARRMRDLNVGTLPVCDENERLVGMITDRDIAIRSVADGRSPTTPVRDAMTAKVIHCSTEDDVKDAANLMKRHQIRRLVVLDEGRRLAGIVSLGDLAVETRGAPIVGDALERISEPVHPVM